MTYCEHCGSTVDQYNGPLKFELGQAVVVKNSDIGDWRGREVKILRINRKNYPHVYQVTFVGEEDSWTPYFAEDDLTNISAL